MAPHAMPWSGAFCSVLSTESAIFSIAFLTSSTPTVLNLNGKRKLNVVWVSTHLQHVLHVLPLLQSFSLIFLAASWSDSTWNFFEWQCSVCESPSRGSLSQHLVTLPHLQRLKMSEKYPAGTHQQLLLYAHPWLSDLV